MSALFLLAFNLSIAASYFILAIVVFRLIFRKAPKWVNCILWALVGLRLAIPFSIESDLSLLPTSHTVITDRESTGLPFSVDSGIYTVDENVNGYLKSHYYEGITVPENAFVDTMFVLSVIWLIGVSVMLLYSVISFIRLKKRVSVSLIYRDNIYYCDNIETPFILGTIRPKIYIPSGLEEAQIENVVMHEKAHLKRKDHWWKPLGFLILSFYWFNPVIWVAYILLCRDIEKACDEKVIKNMNAEEKKDYLETLVDCSVQRKMVLTCPVAFGEVGVKQRVKAVLNYKKPAFWVVLIAIIVTVAVSVGFLTNPKEYVSIANVVAKYKETTTNSLLDENEEVKNKLKKLESRYPLFFGIDTSDGLVVYVTEKDVSHYMCYLSSSKNTVDPKGFEDFSKFALIEDMALILSSYDISGYAVQVVPFQHNLSDYVWEEMESETEYVKMALGLPSIEDESLKTFNATIVDIDTHGIVVEPFEDETEKTEGFNRILLEGIYGDVINSKIRVVYNGRIITEHSTYPHIISSVIAVDNITDEKESSKVVSVNIDENLLGFCYDETTFLKEMKEYGARVNESADGEACSVIFNESKYNDFLTDKYNQVASIYNGFAQDNEHSIFKKVEFDKDFRNLKIYIDKELYEFTSFDQIPGVIHIVYSYQIFLDEGIGVNVEVIDYKTNEVYASYKYPEDDWRNQDIGE